MGAQSEPHWRAAIDAYRRTGEGSTDRLISCLARLGAMYCFEDRDGALPLQEEALDLSRKLYGDEHAEIVDALHGLGFGYYRSASPPRYDEAERCLREAVAMAQRLTERDDRAMGRLLHTYAAMLSRQGRHEESQAMYERAMSALGRAHGRGSRSYVLCHLDYAEALLRAGLREEAALEFDILEEPIREVLGEQATAAIWSRRGTLASGRGEHADAAACYAEALAIYLRSLAVRNPALRPLCLQVDRWPEDGMAEVAELAEHVQVLRQIAPREHNDIHLVSSVLTELGDLAAARRDWQSAETFLREALHGEAVSRSRGHWRLAPIESRLGAVLVAAGRHAEGEQFLRDSYARLSETRGSTAPETIEAHRRLAMMESATDAGLLQSPPVEGD